MGLDLVDPVFDPFVQDRLQVRQIQRFGGFPVHWLVHCHVRLELGLQGLDQLSHSGFGDLSEPLCRRFVLADGLKRRLHGSQSGTDLSLEVAL